MRRAHFHFIAFIFLGGKLLDPHCRTLAGRLASSSPVLCNIHTCVDRRVRPGALLKINNAKLGDRARRTEVERAAFLGVQVRVQARGTRVQPGVALTPMCLNLGSCPFVRVARVPRMPAIVSNKSSRNSEWTPVVISQVISADSYA